MINHAMCPGATAGAYYLPVYQVIGYNTALQNQKIIRCCCPLSGKYRPRSTIAIIYTMEALRERKPPPRKAIY